MKYIKKFNDQILSEHLQYHIDNDISVTESIFRYGSESYFNLLKETRSLYNSGKIKLSGLDKELFESTDIGLFGNYNGEVVPLDLPMEVFEELNEAEYKGKKVKLNYPMRGGSKKYQVYVKDPKSGNVKKISFGDTTGLTAKVSNPEARKSFAARHQCDKKKDKMTAGYWACRLTKFGHLWNGSTYPGFW